MGKFHIYCLDEIFPYAEKLYVMGHRLLDGQGKGLDKRRSVNIVVQWSIAYFRAQEARSITRAGRKVVSSRALVHQWLPLDCGSSSPWRWSFRNLAYTVHELSHVHDDHRLLNGRPPWCLRGKVRWGDRPQEKRAIKSQQVMVWQLVLHRSAQRDFNRLVELGEPLYYNPHRGKHRDHQVAGMLRTGRRPMLT